MKKRDLARAALELVTEAIESDFGCEMVTGAELEFRAWGKGNAPLTQAQLATAFSLPPHLRKENQRLGYEHYRPSEVVDRFYKETGDQQYEIATRIDSPERTAHLIEVLKDVLRKNTIEGLEEYKDKLSEREYERLKEAAAKYGVRDVMFDAYDGTTSNGMHINVSLWVGNKNLMADRSDGDVWRGHVMDGLIDMSWENILLLAPERDDYGRFDKENKSTPHNIRGAIKEREEDDEQRARVEYRIPGANCDARLAMLVVAAGVYAWLEDKLQEKGGLLLTDKNGIPQLADTDRAEFERDDLRLPKTLSAAIERCEGGGKLYELLDALAERRIAEIKENHMAGEIGTDVMLEQIGAIKDIGTRLHVEVMKQYVAPSRVPAR